MIGIIVVRAQLCRRFQQDAPCAALCLVHRAQVLLFLLGRAVYQQLLTHLRVRIRHLLRKARQQQHLHMLARVRAPGEPAICRAHDLHQRLVAAELPRDSAPGGIFDGVRQHSARFFQNELLRLAREIRPDLPVLDHIEPALDLPIQIARGRQIVPHRFHRVRLHIGVLQHGDEILADQIGRLGNVSPVTRGLERLLQQRQRHRQEKFHRTADQPHIPRDVIRLAICLYRVQHLLRRLQIAAVIQRFHDPDEVRRRLCLCAGLMEGIVQTHPSDEQVCRLLYERVLGHVQPAQQPCELSCTQRPRVLGRVKH